MSAKELVAKVDAQQKQLALYEKKLRGRLFSLKFMPFLKKFLVSLY